MAEATGVFFYVFPGIAAVASFTVNAAAPLPVPFFSNILQIGFAFSIGITFAIIICAPVSGGHFNPAITICFAIWQGFPWRKVPHYIFSQIFGAFVAGMVLMGAFWPEISALKAASIAKEGTAVFNGGPASILCVFPNPNQTNHGFLFFQEFFVDSFIGIVICTFLPPFQRSRIGPSFLVPLPSTDHKRTTQGPASTMQTLSFPPSPSRTPSVSPTEP